MNNNQATSASRYIMDNGDINIELYLIDNEYKNIEEWALDSDYSYDDNYDVWYDEEHNPVDIESKLWYAIDSLVESKEE